MNLIKNAKWGVKPPVLSRNAKFHVCMAYTLMALENNADDITQVSMQIDGLKICKPEAYLKIKQPGIPEDLWHGLLRQGTLNIFFGDTNIGKSIMLHQILNDICRAHPEEGGLYIDLEMTDSQLMERYYNPQTGEFYPWPSNFYYANSDVDRKEKELSMEELLAELDKEDAYIDKPLKQTISKVCVSLIERPNLKYVVIDNISALETDAEKTNNATILMKWLQKLKNLLKLTVIVAAHTPKVDRSRPIDTDMLAGSKKLSALCEGMIAMNRVANSTSDVYLKHSKNRSKESDEYNRTIQVLRFTLEEQNGFPYFRYIGIEFESALLPDGDVFKKAQTKAKLDETKAKLDECQAELNAIRLNFIKSLNKNGCSLRKISEQLTQMGFLSNIGKDKISNDLKTLGLKTPQTPAVAAQAEHFDNPFTDEIPNYGQAVINTEPEPREELFEDDPFPPATTPPFFLFCPDRVKHLLRPTA